MAVVLVAESGADGNGGGGEFGIAGHPAADIELVRALVSEVAVAIVKLPMPIVVEAFAGDWDDFARAAPEIIIY